jgi:hypothetical protein
LAIHCLGLEHADGYIHSHIVGGLAQEPLKSQAAVMQASNTARLPALV